MDELFGVVSTVIVIVLVGFALFVALIVWAVRKAMAKAKTIGKAPVSLFLALFLLLSPGSVAFALVEQSESFYAALDAKFKPGSISWDRFAVGADTALTAIVRNTAQLANGIQAFNSDEYRRMQREFSGASEIPDATQAERWGMLQGRLDGMKEIVAGNDKMLLELDRLEAELGKLESSERSAESDDILAEIHTLTEEMKYYQ